MRVIEVHPGEPFAGRGRIGACRPARAAGGSRTCTQALSSQDPCACGLDHVLCAPLGPFDEITGMLLPIPVVVFIESAIQAETRIENERADKCAGPITCRCENRREGWKRLTEPEDAVGANTMDRRRDAR